MNTHSDSPHGTAGSAPVARRTTIRSFLRVALATSLLAAIHTSSAHAGAIWTDANDDGLPDAPGTLLASTGDVVSVDIWIDSQSFAWTNFIIYAEWQPACFTYVSAQYTISGATNFPVDTFSHPSGVGFGGFGYSRQGVEAIGTVNLRALTAGVCCVTPIIDSNNSYGVFSQLGADADYFLFTSNPNSCWTVSSTPEACCFVNGSCTLVTPEDCVAAGGQPQGAGTTCGTVSCEPAPPRGACCMASGSCTSPVTAAECTALGGAYQGDDTDCATVSCPVPTGACCYTSGVCVSPIPAADCAIGGGTYQGNGTTCATVVCPPPQGACCFNDATCQLVTAAACASSGGDYQGDGTSCATADCIPPEGACCLAGAECSIQTEVSCAANGGIYRGDGTQCATAACPGVGACCIPSGGCAPDYTPQECEAAGGLYLGEGSECGVGACMGRRIWADGDGDGLPEIGGAWFGDVGEVVPIDIWIDSQGYEWTNYMAYVEWPANCMSFDSAEYTISGGTNFPIDDFSHPSGVGFTGSGFNEIGIDRIGRVRVRLDAPFVTCCVTPIIDPNNPFSVVSLLGVPGSYQLFDLGYQSCWEALPPPATGACCFLATQTCQTLTFMACFNAGGTYLGDGTSCASDSCPTPPPPATGACCVDSACIGELTRVDCESAGGMYRGDGSTCAIPGICDIPPGCGGVPPGFASVFPLRESAGDASNRSGEGGPCVLAVSTNGTAANYRWYNVCSGYIWIYTGQAQGEGVGVRFGGSQQPAVNCNNYVKRAITYFRNVCSNYNQTVDVIVDADANNDGCPDAVLASDLNLDPGLRWNCSDVNASIPFSVTSVIVRTVHHGGFSPAFATDGPFTATCDPNAPGRSYYYGINGSACIGWRGPDNTYDNFLYWLILDQSSPCGANAVEPTTWGKIKGMYR